MSKIQNKALKMGDEVEKTEESYFFPDINGKAVTVTAKNREEAEEIAKKITEI